MADLGTIPEIFTTDPPLTLLPIADYTIHRGIVMGSVPVHPLSPPLSLVTPLNTYIVRQIRILFRQLWPAHGQRFPQ